MAIIKRINPKTNEIEFRVRFLWKDADGNRKDSKTGWFISIEEAENEAKKLKFLREKDARTEYANRKEQTVEYVFGDIWIPELQSKAFRETTENTTTEHSLWKKASSLFKHYMPDDVKKRKIKDLSETSFRIWMAEINSMKLSGRTIRDYRMVLTKFNQYLGNNGYYSDADLDRRIDTTLARMHVKPKATGERKDRRIPTVVDIEEIVAYYDVMGLGDFKNFYWYTLWYVLFYSGLRVSELIGLQWKFVDLERDTIDIRNSISERETKSNVIKRVSEEVYHTKNARSERIIPIFAKYSQLLADYKKSFKYHFELGEKEIKDCFVFPLVLYKKEDLHDYQKQKNILRELKRVCEIQGVEETDVQMMRHGCATWMVSDRDDGGLGFTESEAKDYFGHTGDDMLREVYAKLNKKQRARRTRTTFKDLMVEKQVDDPKEVVASKEVTNLTLNPKENEEIIEQARLSRIIDELNENIRKGKKKYEFYDEDFGEVMQACANYYYLDREKKKWKFTEKIELIWIHNGKKERMNDFFSKMKEK